MEDFEKKYKDLVKAVKELQEANPSDQGIQNWVNDNFPELAESEDERIKEDLIQWFNEFPDTIWRGHYKKDVIAWLEKQKSSFDINEICSPNNCASNSTYYREVTESIEWLKSLKERCSWKPSEEQLDVLHDAAVYVDKSMFPHPKGILMKLYKQLKKLREE